MFRGEGWPGSAVEFRSCMTQWGADHSHVDKSTCPLLSGLIRRGFRTTVLRNTNAGRTRCGRLASLDETGACWNLAPLTGTPWPDRRDGGRGDPREAKSPKWIKRGLLRRSRGTGRPLSAACCGRADAWIDCPNILRVSKLETGRRAISSRQVLARFSPIVRPTQVVGTVARLSATVRTTVGVHARGGRSARGSE